MIMKKILLFTAITFLSLSIYAQQKHPIEIKLEQCLDTDTNKSTFGMIQCADIAIQDWDKELNNNYKLLMNSLDAESKSMLKNSQIQWLKYRDLEFNFSTNMYEKIPGSMWTIEGVLRKVDIVKTRALELKYYYENYITYKE